MNCSNPQIIINPSLSRVSYLYPFLKIKDRDIPNPLFYSGSKNRGAIYPFKLHPGRLNITLDDLSACYAYNKDGDTFPLYLAVPCGKCDVCVVSKQIQFGDRLFLEQYAAEMRGCPVSYFVTLTYDRFNLPYDGVNKKDIQLFLKRFRITMERKFKLPPFRYCCFSEYGTRTGRAHYHMILFGVKLDTLKLPYFVVRKYLRRCWRKGFVDVKQCHCNSFAYLSKYMLKGSNVPVGQNPNFRLCSNRNGGIGCPALVDPEIVKQLHSPTDLKICVRACGKIRTIQIPRSLVKYYFRECDLKYRSMLSEHVFNLLRNLNALKRYAYNIDSSHIHSSWFDSAIRRCTYLSYNSDLLQDCIDNKVPRFIVERYPFLHDIYTSCACGSLQCNNSNDVQICCANILNILNYLSPIVPDLQTICENNIYLQKISDLLLLQYGIGKIQEDNAIVVRCLCRDARQSFCFRVSQQHDQNSN